VEVTSTLNTRNFVLLWAVARNKTLLVANAASVDVDSIGALDHVDLTYVIPVVVAGPPLFQLTLDLDVRHVVPARRLEGCAVHKTLLASIAV
jgi:hypothetical protein